MSETIVKVTNLSKSFGKLEVIKDVSFSVEKGQVLGIIGPSGSGKSTMMRCINQLETVSGGTIQICGETLVKDGIYADKKKLREIGLHSGLVFQNFNLFPHFSVLKNITEAQIQRQAHHRADSSLPTCSLSADAASDGTQPTRSP